MDETKLMTRLDAFTRRKHAPEEVYLFTVTLCDNEVDRDYERFSLEALKSLKNLFTGKTGIFDHDPKASGQTARIFETELVSDSARKTAQGEPYTMLKAHAYMVRTASNADLIKEIDGGIKKEISISCQSRSKICSICGKDVAHKSCGHIPGRMYDGSGKEQRQGTLCHHILGRISDAYEWSFVAVPAQRAAGVTKFYHMQKEGENNMDAKPTHEAACQTPSSGTPASSEQETENAMLLKEAAEEILTDIRRFAYFSGQGALQKSMELAASRMTLPELFALRRCLREDIQKAGGIKSDSDNISAKSPAQAVTAVKSQLTPWQNNTTWEKSSTRTTEKPLPMNPFQMK